jgi:tetrahydromethanopterin S-methyltransferase subunit A
MNSEKRDDSLGVIRTQLAEAIKAGKCHKCGCFLQALDAIERSESVRTGLAQLLAEARAVALPKQYDCLGCAVCWPAIAINALAQVDSSAAEGLGSCPTDAPEERAGWPPLPGDYQVVRYHAPVAVCSLNSDALARRLAKRAPEGLAIAGTLHTENLGIERIILNTIANPNIWFLILCGEDARQAIGHLPGQSLESLFANGLDDRMRILGALGKRPFLKNVTPEQVDAFARQIALVPRIGEQDEAVILNDIDVASARSPGPFEGAPVKLPVETIRANEPRHLIPDPAGYFVIYPRARDRCLMLEHYTKAGVLTCVIQGNSSIALYSAAVERGLLTRLDHAAYLGRELARAEHALRTGEAYVQDRAPGDLAEEAVPEGCGCATGGAAEDSR